MSTTINSSKTYLQLIYNNHDITKELKGHIMDWNYTDNLSGSIDDLQVTLEDIEHKWIQSWFPSKGSILQAYKYHQQDDKAIGKVNLGKFEIDEITASGPGVNCVIKALSTPEKSSLRREEKSRSWEKVTLRTIAGDIAKANGLKLIYKAVETDKQDRVEQDEQSDIAFLFEQCSNEGLCLKITHNAIVILDESDYEQKDPITTIYRDNSNKKAPVLVKDWSAKTTLTGVYHSCIVKHKDTKSKKLIKGTFTPPKPPKTSRKLIIKSEVKSVAAAQKLAKKKLREANKDSTTVDLTIYTHKHLYAGQTVMLKKFGKFDGKYIITTVNLPANAIKLRKCLVGY